MAEYFFIALIASTIGGICGVGGGIIIKPLLDFTGIVGVEEASFLSSCTVFCMSLYNVTAGLLSGDNSVDLKNSTPLAVGAAAGGVIGNVFFSTLCRIFDQNHVAGIAQSLCLMLIVATLVYVFAKDSLRPLNIRSRGGFVGIGLILGAISSFLGIGGGPFNIMVLCYIIGMETKQAVENSLYIILFGQAANLILMFLSGAALSVHISRTLLMICGGVGGGVLGRKCKMRMNNAMVEKLFIILLLVIICICACNIFKFAF